MAGILTKKKLEDADIDVGHAGEAVNTKKVIHPRYGEPFKSIPLVVEEGEAEISNLRNAIDIAAAAGAGENGWTAQLIADASGRSQQDINDLTAEFKATTSTELNLANFLSKADFQKLKNLDRSLDITDYIKTLIAEYGLKRTNASDVYGSSQGLLKIRLPKGVYTIRPNEIKISGAYGFQIEGDGVSTTVILCKSDAGVFFDFTPYLNIKFKDLSIIHQPVSSDRSTWTNSLFKLNGYGGGRRFKLDSVYVVGFNRQLDFVSQGNVNEDTTYADNCQFTQYKTFLYSRSSQAVNNSFTRCSWSGVGDRTFDVSNYGHTQISDSGVVFSGSFFHLGSHPTFYGPTAQFTFTNVKFEWYNPSGTNVNGTTKIISTDDDITIAAYFKLIKCGISGGSGDQTINHFDLKAGNVVVDVDGGEWEGVNIGLKAFTVGDNVRNRSWVRFANCARSPNTTINRTFASNSSVAPVVIFKNNRGTADIVNIGSGTSGENYLLSNDLVNKNTATNQQGRLITGSTPETHAIPSYGQLVMIDKVRVMIKSSVGATSSSAKLYLTSDKSTLIEEVPIVAQAAPQAISFASAVGLTTTDGIYVEVVNSNANITIPGFVIAETVSI